MEVKKIGEIKAELEKLGSVATRESAKQFEQFINVYKEDDRGGVQKIVLTAEKRLEKYMAEVARTESIKKYEKELGTLRTIMKRYVHQIDSLNTINSNLQKQISSK